MHPTAPSPIRVSYANVRIEGTLSAVRSDDQTFTLTAPDGTTVPGWLGEDRAAVELARFLNATVVLLGVGRFDRAGNLLCVAANRLLSGDPPRRDARPSVLTAAERREVARRLREGLGAWPGDEADERELG